jgi:transposase
MAQEALFPGSEPTPKPESEPPAGGRPRFQAPVRTQRGWEETELDGLLGGDHRARTVWAFVQSLDLQPFYRLIRSVEAGAGRPAIDPAILMTLWLYATAEGVGSARALAKLCASHDAYRWICGGVSVNYHALSDFRTAHGERLDVLLTQSVAALMDEGIVSLERVSQDGVKVRASAGAASFRGKERLEECLRQAKEQVETLKRELTEDPGATTARQAAARTRAAREREERVQRAIAAREVLEQQRTKETGPKKDKDPPEGGSTTQETAREADPLEKPEEAPKKAEKKQPRASTTDAEARVMKMADGGFRPALSTQFSTDTKSQIVVGVEVDNCVNDSSP